MIILAGLTIAVLLLVLVMFALIGLDIVDRADRNGDE